MKKLYILRHAKSDYPDNTEDHERPLNKRGEKACQTMGKYFKENNIKPQKIICSDAVRTSQTIKNILREAGAEIDVEYSKKLYLATPGEMLRELAKIDDKIESVMLVCHNPGAEGLAKILAGYGEAESMQRLNTKYPTAGLAVLYIDTDNWQRVSPGSGHLEEFVTPKLIEK